MVIRMILEQVDASLHSLRLEFFVSVKFLLEGNLLEQLTTNIMKSVSKHLNNGHCAFIITYLLAASMVFNDDGRYNENGLWTKMMYGAFAGPRYIKKKQ